MRLQLATQPDVGGYDLAAFLHDVSSDPANDTLTIIVAWAKLSGLRLVRDSLTSFRDRGGYIRSVVGVSQGGATREGLQAIAELSDEAFVFHHRSSRTFHPKAYFATGADRFSLFLGSNNLTRGGVIENFESSIFVDGDLSADSHIISLANELEDYWSRLTSDSSLCVPLTEESLVELLDDGSLGIADETDNQGGPRADTQVEAPTLFPGPSQHVLKRAQRPEREDTSREAGPGDEQAPDSLDQPGAVSHRWFKKLRPADAQRLGGRSKPTGHLTLVQAGHPMVPDRYFRQQFFASETWKGVPGTDSRERAAVRFEVVAHGHDLGQHILLVDHYPKFGSDQNNRTLTLRWGDALNDYLRHREDHSGDYVTLERRPGRPHLLTFSSEPIGEFL